MSTRKAARAVSSDMQMIKMACSRRRARCTHETCYNHSNLAAYVQSALGDAWRIVLPPELGVSCRCYCYSFYISQTIPTPFSIALAESQTAFRVP